MEIIDEKEKIIFDLLKGHQHHLENFEESKINDLIQQSLHAQKSRVDELKKEIEKDEYINSLCNLSLQTKIIECMKDESSTNRIYADVLVKWTPDILTQWINLAKRIKQELEKEEISAISFDDIETCLSKMVSTTAENLYIAEHESPRKFLSEELVPYIKEGGESPSKKKKNLLETDLNVIPIDHSSMAQEEDIKIDDSLVTEYIELSAYIQKELEQVILKCLEGEDNEKSYTILGIVYLTFPIKQVIFCLLCLNE